MQHNTYLKYLTRSHTILGIFVIFIFYISTFFGTITVFKPYLSNWENPSRHFKIDKNISYDLDGAVKVGLEALDNPTDKIKVTLPSIQNNAIAVKYGFSEDIYINPNTNTILDTKNETQFLSHFFNEMHINMQMEEFGQYIVGFSSIAIIFLTISGIYLWLKKRKKRTNTKTSFWFKWHKDLSLVILPYIIVFSMTGAVLGVMLNLSSPFAYSVTDGKELVMSKLVRPIIFPNHARVKPSGETVLMESLNSLYKKAQREYPNLNITDFAMAKWNDKNARVVFRGYLNDNRILSARTNRMSIVLSGSSGEVIKKNTLNESHTMSQVMSAFYFFHFLTDEGLIMRILFLIFGILFGASLIFGMFIWLEKQSLKNKKDKEYFSVVSTFTTALTMGVIPASALVVFLYWLLPFTLDNKQTWLIGSFFLLWSFTLFYSVYKKEALQSVKFFFTLSSIFLLLAVLFHGISTDMFFWKSYQQELFNIFGMDIVLLALAIFFLVLSRSVERVKILQRFKGF